MRLNSREQPTSLVQASGAQGIGGEPEQCVRPRTVRVDPVRIATTGGLQAGKRGAVEGTGEVMGAELTVVRRAGGQREGRDHRVGVVTERIQDGRRRRVVALAA
ncbi:hypothetical protein [Lentzea terrae]|uniref:hypothetical protein n=1 Tax=Lentzea terrae TaxID=2200761 RepID=UPI001300515F|nr:hypothetical protein [Lentzea terrae]